MRSVFIASLRLYTRRYVAAASAVCASVAFVVVIGLITAGARQGLMDSFGAPFRNADAIVDAIPVEDPLPTDIALEIVERLGVNASGLGRIFLPVRSASWEGSATVGPVAPPALRWQTLVEGRFPEREGEVVVHVWTANEHEIATGDTLRVGEGDAAAALEVVGVVDAPSPVAQASMYVAWPQYIAWRHLPSFHVSRVAVRGDTGPLPDNVAAYDPEVYVREGLATLNDRTDTIGLLLLLLTGIAFAVSTLVIANTFAILLAQRLRDFALLRCVGATRGQVLGSVRGEAVAVGAAASLAGVGVGIGLGYALIALINARAVLMPLGYPPLPLPWLVAGFVVGLAVTVAASWVPARRVMRVSPLSALRPQDVPDSNTGPARRAVRLSAVLVAAGTALLAAAMAHGQTTVMLAGGAALLAGVLLSGPVTVPFLIRIVGLCLGTAGRLATTSAVRNPRRTAATTSSLLVGITVLSAVLTGMATTQTAVEQRRDRAHVVDVALIAEAGALDDDVLDRVRRTDGVEEAIAVNGVMAQVAALAEPLPVLATSDAHRAARDGGAFARLDAGTIRVDRSAFIQRPGFRPGDTITVRAHDKVVELVVADDSPRGWGRAAVVAPETLARLTDAATPRAIWVRAAPGADHLKLVNDLDDIADVVGARVEDQLQARATEERQLGILRWSVIGLLGAAQAIALIGIANTLGLSVLERAREYALLRALGLTRRRLRWMLACEALLLSSVATLLGNALGVAFAWVGYETFVKRALAEAALRVPWASLGGVALVTAAAALAASVLPARRAARVTPAQGLS